MLTRERKTEIEQDVVDVLEAFGMWEYPVSVARVAKALDIELIPYSSLKPQTRELARSISEDAFTIRTNDLTRVQLVVDDRGAYYYRSRFSGAHELGHVLLDHPDDDWPNEEEANYFGGYLLAPHPLVLLLGDDTDAIAETFGISRACASFALDQARSRRRDGRPCQPHEKKLLDNVTWKGGGLLAKP